MKNGQLQHLNPWQKVFLFLFTVMFAYSFAMVSYMAAAKFLLNTSAPEEIISDLTRIDSIRMMKIGNLIIHLLAFIAPAIVLIKIFNFSPKEAILFKKPSSKVWIWVPVLFVFLTLINQGLYAINHQIDFSFISGSLQETFEYQQAVMEKTVFAYIGGTWKSYLVNLFLIALVPAISEELLFRGLIQNLFSKATQNIWLGIGISAFLFALIHFQPFNFLPMFALGFCYGMIAAYTGSLWITMLLHFLNNALMLTLEHFEVMFGWQEFEVPLLLSLGLILTCLTLLIIAIKSGKTTSKWYETRGIYLR